MTAYRDITMVEAESMRTSLVYLGTPYTKYRAGLDAAAHEAARIAAALSLATGGAIFSPIAHSHALARAGHVSPLDEALFRPLNTVMMLASDILVVVHMDGWAESIGLTEEIGFFLEARKPIFDLLDPARLDLVRRQPERPERDRIDDKSAADIRRDHADWFAQGKVASP